MRSAVKFGAAIIAAWLAVTGVAAQEKPVDARQLWQLLDYVAVDYSGAVEKGKVVSEAEYAEMLDFTANAATQIQALPAHATKNDIAAAIKALREAVVRKADAAEVARLAHQANALLVGAYPIPVAPKTVPDVTKGRSLYTAHCASCHGASGNGDGSLATSLDPKPIAFTDAERARARSVMALYQVISQGVEGTSMASFESLPEEERWALAFYIGTLANDDGMRQRGEALWKSGDATIRKQFPDLAALTTTTEDAAGAMMQKDVARDVTAFLRSHPTVVETNKPTGLALARLRLQESLNTLKTGDSANATRLALSAYLDGLEPLEPMLGTRNSALLIDVENAMLAYRSAVAKGSVEQAAIASERLEQLFSQVESELGESKADPMTTFIGALTILLREGLEALLIVIGMVAFLKKAERHDALRHVHIGWISALGAGVLTWVVATYVVEISGASREVTEGLGALLAAVVLLGVGLWMHQKSSAGRWQEYLKQKLSAALTQRSAWALFGLSFIAVYREVFETVLFYSALAADGNGAALLGGFLLAVVLLTGIAWVLLRTSARMPIGKFFSVSSILMAGLAIVLAGKGLSALQEAGWVSVNPIAFVRVELLGIYPTMETMAIQLLVLGFAAAFMGRSWTASRLGGA